MKRLKTYFGFLCWLLLGLSAVFAAVSFAPGNADGRQNFSAKPEQTDTIELHANFRQFADNMLSMSYARPEPRVKESLNRFIDHGVSVLVKEHANSFTILRSRVALSYFISTMVSNGDVKEDAILLNNESFAQAVKKCHLWPFCF